jgi:prepilin-type N-terminal cleavage/methylation domain-containing protein
VNGKSQSGFSLVEMLVGMVVGSLVLAGAYSLWKTHQKAGYQLGKKIDLRNAMTLSSKRIQRSITLAGIGLSGVANISMVDAAGSDTLDIFTNQGQLRSALVTDVDHGSNAVQVTDPTAFDGVSCVVIITGNLGEIREISNRYGAFLYFETSLDQDHPQPTSFALPATRERIYSIQESNQLIRDVEGSVSVVASNVKNFQVSFSNKRGEPTSISNEVRTVKFSFKGVYPADQGALNTINFSSTAIPRNLL